MAQDGIGPAHRLMVIGGSAGSLEPLLSIVSSLPGKLVLPVVVVVHRKTGVESSLVSLLGNKTVLPVKEVEDKEELTQGMVYVAPPDYHLLIENERCLMLDVSEKIHFSRPAIDATFESAAEVFGAAVIGILLSGASADGAQGLKKIAEKGGHTIVQEPSSADVDYMPAQALAAMQPDAVLDVEGIKKHLQTLHLNAKL